MFRSMFSNQATKIHQLSIMCNTTPEFFFIPARVSRHYARRTLSLAITESLLGLTPRLQDLFCHYQDASFDAFFHCERVSDGHIMCMVAKMSVVSGKSIIFAVVMRRILLILSIALLSLVAVAQEVPADTVVPMDTVVPVDTVVKLNKIQQFKQRMHQRIEEKKNEPYDTIRDKGYWWRALKHGKIDLDGGTID